MAGLGKEGQVLGIRGTTLAGVPLGCRHPVVQLSPCLVTFSSRQLAHRLPLARWRHGSGHRPGCLGGSSYAAARRIARPAAYRGAETWSRSEAHAPRLHGIGHGPWARRRCVAAGAGYPRLCLCPCAGQMGGRSIALSIRSDTRGPGLGRIVLDRHDPTARTKVRLERWVGWLTARSPTVAPPNLAADSYVRSRSVLGCSL